MARLILMDRQQRDEQADRKTHTGRHTDLSEGKSIWRPRRRRQIAARLRKDTDRTIQTMETLTVHTHIHAHVRCALLLAVIQQHVVGLIDGCGRVGRVGGRHLIVEVGRGVSGHTATAGAGAARLLIGRHIIALWVVPDRRALLPRRIVRCMCVQENGGTRERNQPTNQPINVVSTHELSQRVSMKQTERVVGCLARTAAKPRGVAWSTRVVGEHDRVSNLHFLDWRIRNL